MARPRGFRPLIRGPARKTAWGVGPTSNAVQESTGTGTVLMTQGSVATSEGLTLVRTRGEMMLWLTNATADGDGFHGAIAIGVVTLEAFTAGIASIPGPLASDDWDGWLWHQYFTLLSNGLMSGAAQTDRNSVNPVVAGVRYQIDSKAMRKFPDDMVIFGIVQQTEVGTSTLRMFMQTRLLFKLA